MDDILFNGSNEPIFEADFKKLNAAADEKMKLALRQWEEDFKDTFTKTPQGRRVLWWLIHETYIFRTTNQFNASAYGVLAKQALGNEILSVVGAEKVLECLIQVKKENQLQGVRDV